MAFFSMAPAVLNPTSFYSFEDTVGVEAVKLVVGEEADVKLASFSRNPSTRTAVSLRRQPNPEFNRTKCKPGVLRRV